MNVSLTPQLERLINRKVKTGMYQTASEVVREALRLLNERDAEFVRLKAAIDSGLEQLTRREVHEYDEESLGSLRNEIKAAGRKSIAKSRRSDTTVGRRSARK